MLEILLVGKIIRLLAAPYTAVLVGAGLQRQVMVSPVLEGVLNLAASVLLGLRFGAEGVAYGTLIGAVIGMAAHAFYNVPHTNHAVRLSSSEYVLSGIGVPLLTSIPFLVLRSFSCIFSYVTVAILIVVLALASANLRGRQDLVGSPR